MPDGESHKFGNPSYLFFFRMKIGNFNFFFYPIEKRNRIRLTYYYIQVSLTAANSFLIELLSTASNCHGDRSDCWLKTGAALSTFGDTPFFYLS